ncbi:MAG TPA: hypothetical protein VEC16_01515 [Alphaproteobacteria bacterium]|nr:hypothetical protein [Alphaproteobacteria bacterium]
MEKNMNNFGNKDIKNTFMADMNEISEEDNKVGNVIKGYVINTYLNNSWEMDTFEIKIDNLARHIFAPKMAELLENKLFTGNDIIIEKRPKDLYSAFNEIKATSSDSETENFLDIIVYNNYKILGKSSEGKPINVIFERHGSNYTIRNHGLVSNNLISRYTNNNN